jgi:hypothetical protein
MIAIGRLEPGEAVEIEIYKKGYTYALLEEDEDKYSSYARALLRYSSFLE